MGSKTQVADPLFFGDVVIVLECSRDRRRGLGNSKDFGSAGWHNRNDGSNEVGTWDSDSVQGKQELVRTDATEGVVDHQRSWFNVGQVRERLEGLGGSIDVDPMVKARVDDILFDGGQII